MSTQLPVSRLIRRFRELCQKGSAALSDGVGSLSYAALGHAVSQLAAELRLQLGSGAARHSAPRVALLAEPGRDWVIGFWAILEAGAATVPLSPLHQSKERREFFEASGAQLLVVSAAHRAEAEQIAGALPAIVLDGFDVSGAAAPASHRESPLAPLEAITALTAETEQQPALIMFTSGTTARPKVVPLTHGNLYEQALSLSGTWGMSAEDVLIHSLPLHHVHGISVAFLLTFLSGGETAFSPKFDPAAVLDLARRASVLMAVPAQYKRLIDELESHAANAGHNSLRNLRLLTSGSAKLPESLGRRIEELAGQYPVERYGMTEIGIVLSNSLSRRVVGSCGSPLPGCRIRVVDEQGRDVERGEVGELWVSGPTVFCGYDSGQPRSARDFEGDYFRTGDIVRQNAAGDVFIHGRNSVDIIKSGGYKLSALEAEELLREHPEVSDVAVVGVPDEDWGEAMVAVVVLRNAAAPPQFDEVLRRWVRERVAGYKVPKRILFAAELPRNTLGKVQKNELAQKLPSLQ